jgi:nicotinate-nucleotide pyrophosphorylase (carboxylating)
MATQLIKEHIPDILAFLAEDVGMGDITAKIIPETKQAYAELITRESMVLCGREWFEAIFQHLNQDILINWYATEGETIHANSPLCVLKGNARALLTGERTALNLLQTLSATATMSRQYANAIKGTNCKILDTRKTIPGLRAAQKYAVQCGGCYNHRLGLFDGILIKENHIIAAGSISNAIQMARQQSELPIEVEVENLDELTQAIAAKPDRIMLDNFTLEELRAAVKLTTHQIPLEASGNIDLNNVYDVAQTGVDFISIGALTKNIHAIDLSMRINLISDSLNI